MKDSTTRKEEIRMERRISPLDDFAMEIRYAVRGLLKNATFSGVAALTLALGIGVPTAVFSLVNAVVLRPLPFEQPDRLVAVWNARDDSESRYTSEPDFLDYRAHRTFFEDFAALASLNMSLSGTDDPEQLAAARISLEFLPLLGIQPMLGRHFLPEEDLAEGPDATLLSWEFWQRRFGGDPTIVGKPIMLNGRPHTVVGILPAGARENVPTALRHGLAFDVWTPLKAFPERNPRRGRYLSVIGVMKPASTLIQAQGEADVIASRLRGEHPEHAASGYRIRVVPLHTHMIGDVGALLVTLLVAVSFLLLIACSNVASLVLARHTGRQRELAVRAALGATRGRLLRQMLTEAGVLAAVGGTAGVALSALLVQLFLPLVPSNLPRAGDVTIDIRVLGFALAATLVTAILFGLLPAFGASTPYADDTLRDAGRKVGSGRAGHRTLRGLVVAEVSLAVMLLVGAGLMIRSLVALSEVEPGFDAEDVLTFRVSLPRARYLGDDDVVSFYRQVEERLAAIPGVSAVGSTTGLPLSGRSMRITYSTTGDASETAVHYQPISPGFISAIGARMLQGRSFDDHDNADGPPVAIVDQIVADRVWPGESPIGRQLDIHAPLGIQPFRTGSLSVEVVGVVEHLRNHDLSRFEHGQIYVPHAQIPFLDASIAVRGSDPGVLLPAIRERVASLDRSLPIAEVRRMDGYVADALAPTRFLVSVLGLFASLAVVLASVGIYGVLSYVTSRRTAEVGVRVALGATEHHILGLVVGQAMRTTLLGVLLGLAGAAALTRLVAGLLYGVEPLDPLTFSAVAAILLGIAIVASWIPARRAARVSPTVALQHG